MRRNTNGDKGFLAYLTKYGDGITVIISIAAFVFSFVGWYNSLPDESEIEILAGDKIVLFNFYATQKGSQNKICINVPLMVYNIGGKPEIIQKLTLEVTNTSNNNTITLPWNKIITVIEDPGVYRIGEIPTPLLLGANSSEKIYYSFVSDILKTESYWKPDKGKYTFKLKATLYLSKKTKEFNITEYSFNKRDFSLFNEGLIMEGIEIPNKTDL